MAGEETARLIYLVLLGLAIAGYFVAANRDRPGKIAQQAAVWGLIFLGAIAVAGLWSDIRREVAPRQSVFAEAGRIEVPRAPDGHYYLMLQIDGTPVRFVVDTGATDMVLTRADAVRVGLDPDNLVYRGTAHTANGAVQTAPVWLEEVRLGPVVDKNMRAYVNAGQMQDSLLGMAYLQRYSRMEIADGMLVLTR
ncbi:aspartyl protease family protein [Rhodovulum iodosum]|uniref:Aspartyl protease family protein n=1 Tax=Rhodovulum iodosum TaxID=68291 RepID=A0ABV3XY20_9RHOB|nr:TIGR02281 family clan AA aspartic protease [Rhodovulum robiginosum]RSK33635.1 TIGR02281 family clan AA aspartic protease [Rhodovulum robiginosum]